LFTAPLLPLLFAAIAMPAATAATPTTPRMSNRFMEGTPFSRGWQCSSPMTDARTGRFLPGSDARTAAPRPRTRGGPPAAPRPRCPGLDALSRRGRGPRPGDVRACARPTALDPRRGRGGLPAARPAQHADQPTED